MVNTSEKRLLAIEEMVNLLCLGIKMIREDLNIYGQYRGDCVVLENQYGLPDMFDDDPYWIYAIIRVVEDGKIKIYSGGESFLSGKDPRTMEDLKQFDYEIANDNHYWCNNGWDLYVYVEKPEDVIKVLAILEPHWDWSIK